MIPLNTLNYENIDNFNINCDIALRNIFKHEIKENFLIKIYHKVFHILGHEIINYYPLDWSLENSITGDSNGSVFDVCKIIVGLHKSNMIFIPKTERSKKQNSEEYCEKLVKEVIENIKLRKYGSSFFRKKQIIQGDRFLYFHLPYDLFVICTKMNELLVENANQNVPFYSHISKISNIGISALSLLEDNFLDNAYPLCRMIIELYIEMITLLNSPTARRCYANFSQIEFQKTQCGIDYPQEFLCLYESRKNKRENKKNKFLHFGWVDEIKDYHEKVKKNPYSIAGLIEYLKSKNEEDDFNIYEKFYKQCHSYSHANIMGVRYPLLSYFEISIMLYLTILKSYIFLCDTLKVNVEINGINIITKISKDYELLINQFNKKSTDNFESYYKQN